jgi:hypothetical protein
VGTGIAKFIFDISGDAAVYIEVAHEKLDEPEMERENA